MKKNKKWLGIGAAVFALLLIIGACTPTDNTDAADTTVAEITVESPEETTGTPEDTTDAATDKATDKVTDKVTDRETEKKPETQTPSHSVGSGKATSVDPAKLPAYSGKPYTIVSNNIPNFSSAELTTKSYEKYAPLDSLGRCGVTIASVGRDIMPTEDRGSIGSVKPTGWHTVKYDNVDGKYLYNRCHLIGFQLTGENANTRNLITGTRYMNVDGMLPFENMVADYVKETGNHVAYRVTPIFLGNNLLASGVQMEAYSIEDEGDGICFNVYCYNVQPDIEINYTDGTSSYKKTETPDTDKPEKTQYVLNTNSKKFHYPSCSSVKKISAANYAETNSTRDALIADGYDPCGNCKP